MLIKQLRRTAVTCKACLFTPLRYVTLNQTHHSSVNHTNVQYRQFNTNTESTEPAQSKETEQQSIAIPNENPFRSLGINNKELLHSIYQHYTQPSVIQQLAVPALLSQAHTDYIIGDCTGQGKSNVYIWSILELLSRQPLKYNKEYKHSATVYILQPTLELCEQIKYMIQQHNMSNVRITVLSKAIPYQSYCTSNTTFDYNTINILICTPLIFDILLDNDTTHTTQYQRQHNNNITAMLSNTRYIVYDECDIMVYGQNVKHVDSIVKSIRRYNTNNTQQISSILVGASLAHTGHSQSPMQYIYHNFSHAKLCVTDRLHKISDHVTQHWINVTTASHKLNTLYDILNTLYDNKTHCKTLIFCNSTQSVKMCYNALLKCSLFTSNKATLLQYSKLTRRDERITTLQQFQQSQNAVIVCTSILARGMDIPDLNCVIQYDFAENVTDYIHRVGRVARLHSIQHTHSTDAVIYNIYDSSSSLIVERIRDSDEQTLAHAFSFKRSLRKTERKTHNQQSQHRIAQ